VQAQARTGVARVQDQATTDDGKPRPEVVAGTAGAVLLVVGLLWWRRD
jgi:MYXO-CTERM domain-containing protein